VSEVILVVDDDDDVRATLSVVLEEEGYGVQVASNGREALDWLLGHEAPRMILLDLMMPVMDGWAMLDELTHLPTLGGVPIVVLSAADERTVVAKPDVVGYLSKPVDLRELLQAIDATRAPREAS
jgi:CheY-like chemotaxis protein